MSEIPRIYSDRSRPIESCTPVNARESAFSISPSRWNFQSRINIERLAKVAELLMDAHPVLGRRLVVNPEKPYWERLDSESRSVLKIAASETDYNEWLTTTINVEAVVPFAIYILHQGSGDRLCLKIQHQVADAGGLKEIAYKLASIYRKLKTEPDRQPEPNLVASRGYDQLTGKIPWYAWLKSLCNFFKYHFRTSLPFRSHSIKSGRRRLRTSLPSQCFISLPKE